MSPVSGVSYLPGTSQPLSKLAQSLSSGRYSS